MDRRRRRQLRATVAWAFCCAAAQAQLELRHGAPLAGSSMTLEVRGAAPGARIELLASPRPAHLATPWGTLEIEREHATSLANGFADASGAFVTSVALAAADAEEPQHIQALVSPIGAPPQLSPAAHLRVLGSRAYVSCQGVPGFPIEWDGGLAILSLARHEWIATVEYGRVVGAPGQRRGTQPVFRSDFARGVVAPQSDEVLVFDPFFGRVLERLPMDGAATTVFTNRTNEHAFVLDGVAGESSTPTLLRLDLRGSGVAASLPLPGNALSREWTVDDTRGVAYVAGAASANAPTMLRRVDLDSFADLGALTIGGVGSSVTALARSAERVIACLSNGTVVRVRETSGGPEVVVSPAIAAASQLEVLPSFGLIAQWRHFPTMPGGALWLEREASSTGVGLGIGVLNWGGLIDMVESPLGLWAVSANSGVFSGGYAVGEFDVAAGQWTDWNAPFYVNTPAAMARCDDANGSRLCIPTDGVFGDQLYERPRLYVLGPKPGEWEAIPCGPSPSSVRVVSVP